MTDFQIIYLVTAGMGFGALYGWLWLERRD